jgi:hypothetical protein
LRNQFDLPAADVLGLQVLVYDPPASYPIPPGRLYQAIDGTAIALAGARREDVELFLNLV